MSTVPGELISSASLNHSQLKAAAEIKRTQIRQNVLSEFPIRATEWRVFDALATNLPGTPANDDLGLVSGTWGTDDFTIESGDLKAAGATSRYAACIIHLPQTYDAGETIQLKARAAMETTVSDTTATMDFEVYATDGDGTLSSELCSTAAQDINSLTPADFTYTITATSRNPGDLLLVRLHLAINDGATGTAVTGVVYDVSLQCDTRP